MTRLTALSLTPAVRAWLQASRHARILHIFERVVNLIAGDDVISLVTPDVGNGPFNVVLPAFDFARRITPSDPLQITPDALYIGDLVIDVSSAAIWNPYPDWQTIRAQQARLRAHAPVVRAVLQQHAPANSLAHLVVELPVPPSALETHVVNTARQHWQNLVQGARHLDHARCVAGAAQLSGLGSGLTPAGDDWLLGCALAAHAGFPSPEAAALILDAVRRAASGTHSLSASWLRAAADGAGGQDWHTFWGCCLQAETRSVYQAAVQIVRQGHSSGADALAGYVALVGVTPEWI
jgi:hypothetical protein